MKACLLFIALLLGASIASHADANRLRLLGHTGASGGRVIPLTQTVYEGALTLPGMGPNIQYTGTPGHLSITGATGNGATINRLNGCSQLVRGGNVTFGSVTNGGFAYINSSGAITNATRSSGTIASSYDYTVMDSDTGQTGSIHVVMSGTLLIPGGVVSRPVQGNGFVRTYTLTVPDHTIDLAHTRTISAYPIDLTACPGVTNDYPNQHDPNTFLTGGGSNTADGIQAAFADPTTIALGDNFLIEAGNYNVPFVSASFPAGTINYGIRVFMNTPTGTWSGTAPDYDNGPWMNVLFHDRLNTHMGLYQFAPGSAPSYASFEGGIWDMARANLFSFGLGSFTGTPDTTGSNNISALFIGLLSGSADGSFVRVIDNVMDVHLPLGATTGDLTNFANGLNINLGNAAVSDSIIVKNNLFEHGLRSIFAAFNPATYGTNQVLRDNYFTGLVMDDTVHYQESCGFTVTGNYIASSPDFMGPHSDLIQITSDGNTGTAACPLFGDFERNVLNTDDNGVDPNGNPAPGYRLATDGGAEGFFFDGSNSLVRFNLTMKNNAYVGVDGNCIAVFQVNGAVVDHNDCLYDAASTNTVGGNPGLGWNTSANIVGTNNVTSASAAVDNNPTGSNSANNTTNKNQFSVTNASPYSTYFANPDVTNSVHDYASFIQAWKAKTGGPLDGAATNGTSVGAIDTTGGFPSGP